ncbi:hypothetical protein AIGOOFII_4045 [Methylobacterium marchantiae]|nr:hypothetical protein AIGOOFII_4045 [Methylobacterium marchantiae]
MPQAHCNDVRGDGLHLVVLACSKSRPQGRVPLDQGFEGERQGFPVERPDEIEPSRDMQQGRVAPHPPDQPQSLLRVGQGCDPFETVPPVVRYDRQAREIDATCRQGFEEDTAPVGGKPAEAAAEIGGLSAHSSLEIGEEGVHVGQVGGFVPPGIHFIAHSDGESVGAQGRCLE